MFANFGSNVQANCRVRVHNCFRVTMHNNRMLMLYVGCYYIETRQ